MRDALWKVVLPVALALRVLAQTPPPDARGESFVIAWKAANDTARPGVIEQFAPPYRVLFSAVADSGEAAQKKGDFGVAADAYAACADGAIHTADDLYSSICLQLTGGLERLQGKYDDAERHYKQALAYARKPGATSRIPLVQNNLAGVYVVQSRYSEGLELLKATIEYDDREGIQGDAAPYQNIGSIYGLTGDMERSLRYFLKAQAMYEKKGDERRLALVHYNIGVLYVKQANYTAASREFDAGVALATKVGDNTQLAMMYGDVGRMRGLEGKPKEAIEALNRALELSRGIGFKSAYNGALLNIAGFEADQGRYAEALGHFQEARQVAEQLKDGQDEALALRGMSLVARLTHDYKAALSYGEDSLRRAESIGDRNGQWQSEGLAGLAWKGLNNPEKARGSFERAVALIERQRGLVAGGEVEKQRFFEQAAFPYQELALLDARSGNATAAFQSAERTRARTLLDIIAAGPNPIDRLMSAEEQAEEKNLRAGIAVANLHAGPGNERDAAWHAYETFLAALYAHRPELKTWRGESSVVTEEELRSLIPDAKTAILEFLSGQDETLLFTVTREISGVKVHTFMLPIGRAALTALTARYRAQIEGRDPAFRAAARELYDVLLKPAAALLRTRTHICIVPDGPLWELPFQSLPGPAGSYWIEQASISMVPSVTFLRDRNAINAAKRAAGSRTFTHDLVAFSGTRELDDQVRRIAALYDPRHIIVRNRAQAGEAAFKQDAPDAQVLHIAAHGVVDRQNPMHSRIILSQGSSSAGRDKPQSEDGWLEAWELMRMNLHADLAILSACETGRGRVAEGEGLVGLTWALFVAGVRTTVVSQWQVEAGSTTELMVELHRNLRRGEKPAEAMRGAILTLMKSERYRHPMYWSAFVVSGE